jgi:hypothetical protein
VPIYIWISEGPTGEDAKPLLASSDPTVIQQFLRALEQRICGQPDAQRRGAHANRRGPDATNSD